MALAGARARAGSQQAGFPSSQPLQKRPAASNLSDFFYLLMYGFSFFPFFFWEGLGAGGEGDDRG